MRARIMPQSRFAAKRFLHRVLCLGKQFTLVSIVTSVILALHLLDRVNDSLLVATTQHPKLGRLLLFDPTDEVTPLGRSMAHSRLITRSWSLRTEESLHNFHKVVGGGGGLKIMEGRRARSSRLPVPASLTEGG